MEYSCSVRSSESLVVVRMKVELTMSERWNGKYLGSKIRLEWSTCWVKGWVRNGKKCMGKLLLGKSK